MTWLKGLSEYQTVISAGLALALAMVGYFRTTRENRRRYTLDVLMRYSNNAELLKALHRLRTHAAAHAAGGQGEVEVNDELAEDLAVTMPHFAAIALAANKGLLDRQIILEARYASMRSIWKSYGPFLSRKSAELGRPLLHADIEQYLRANERRYREYQARQVRTAAHLHATRLEDPPRAEK